MIVAARTLASLVPAANLLKGSCYPDLDQAREVSVKIAVAVAEMQWERGTARREERLKGAELEAAIRATMYEAGVERK